MSAGHPHHIFDLVRVSGGTATIPRRISVEFIPPKTSLTFGRYHQKCDCYLDEQMVFCSKVHAEISLHRPPSSTPNNKIDAPQLTIKDLGSSNGTFVNFIKISESPLHDGDIVIFGGHRFSKVGEALSQDILEDENVVQWRVEIISERKKRGGAGVDGKQGEEGTKSDGEHFVDRDSIETHDDAPARKTAQLVRENVGEEVYRMSTTVTQMENSEEVVQRLTQQLGREEEAHDVEVQQHNDGDGNIEDNTNAVDAAMEEEPQSTTVIATAAEPSPTQEARPSLLFATGIELDIGFDDENGENKKFTTRTSTQLQKKPSPNDAGVDYGWDEEESDENLAAAVGADGEDEDDDDTSLRKRKRKARLSSAYVVDDKNDAVTAALDMSDSESPKRKKFEGLSPMGGTPAGVTALQNVKNAIFVGARINSPFDALDMAPPAGAVMPQKLQHEDKAAKVSKADAAAAQLAVEKHEVALQEQEEHEEADAEASTTKKSKPAPKAKKSAKRKTKKQLQAEKEAEEAAAAADDEGNKDAHDETKDETTKKKGGKKAPAKKSTAVAATPAEKSTVKKGTRSTAKAKEKTDQQQQSTFGLLDAIMAEPTAQPRLTVTLDQKVGLSQSPVPAHSSTDPPAPTEFQGVRVGRFSTVLSRRATSSTPFDSEATKILAAAKSKRQSATTLTFTNTHWKWRMKDPNGHTQNATQMLLPVTTIDRVGISFDQRLIVCYLKPKCQLPMVNAEVIESQRVVAFRVDDVNIVGAQIRTFYSGNGFFTVNVVEDAAEVSKVAPT